MIKKQYLPLLMTSSALALAALLPAAHLHASPINWESSVDTSWLDPNKPIVAFTFDDGPVSNGASEILDSLEQYHAHATFFYCGYGINETTTPEIKRAFEMGNEIGNHTLLHKNLTELTDEEIRFQVDETAKLLTQITGLQRFLVRPPYLSVNEAVFNQINTPLISTSVDSKDWTGIDSATIISNVLDQVHDGAIILMHEPLAPTVEAVKTLLPTLIEQGYQVASVSEMMAAKGITMTSETLYTKAPKLNKSSEQLEKALITSEITSEWSNGYVVEVHINNTSKTPIEDWTLAFDFKDEISSIWNSELLFSNAPRHTVTYGQWNQSIHPGETGVFGFCSTKSAGTIQLPNHFSLK